MTISIHNITFIHMVWKTCKCTQNHDTPHQSY